MEDEREGLMEGEKEPFMKRGPTRSRRDDRQSFHFSQFLSSQGSVGEACDRPQSAHEVETRVFVQPGPSKDHTENTLLQKVKKEGRLTTAAASGLAMNRYFCTID